MASFEINDLETNIKLMYNKLYELREDPKYLAEDFIESLRLLLHEVNSFDDKVKYMINFVG